MAIRLGAWFDVVGAHHESRATTSDGRPWPPEGSFFAPFGGRQRRLTMSRIAGATLPAQKTRKDDHTYHPIVIEGTSAYLQKKANYNMMGYEQNSDPHHS